MEATSFINYYEILEVSPSASTDLIVRRFRHLARRYHPDNQDTGDRGKFDAVVAAHDTLKDASTRAQYHHDHPHALPPLSSSCLNESCEDEEENNAGIDDGETFFDDLGIDRDISIQDNLLILLYLKRRRHSKEPGIGDAELERLSGCPPEHLEFHIWYLKAKGWIATGENGLLSITVEGVDRAALIYKENATRLLTNRS